MNALTLQIKKDSFQSILKGEQDIEHRYVYPSNVTRYVYFEHDGKDTNGKKIYQMMIRMWM